MKRTQTLRKWLASNKIKDCLLKHMTTVLGLLAKVLQVKLMQSFRDTDRNSAQVNASA